MNKRKEIVKEWVYSPKGNEAIIDSLATETGLSNLQVSILYNRGFKTAKSIKSFLEISLDDFEDTRLMADAEKASDIIISYIHDILRDIESEGISKMEITNYSDYDADGAGSAIVTFKGLQKLGVTVNTFQNHADLGYGICKKGIDIMLEKYPKTKLIITTDNGIVAHEAIDYANSLDIDIIITDHHEPADDGSLPKAKAVVNPKRKDCKYPFKDLCGAGVMFKLLMLVYYKIGKNPKDMYEFLDFVAIATVADVVPLIGENRIIVQEGLKIIREENKLCWKAMRETFVDSFYDPEINSKTIGFSYGPAINACRRMLGSIEIPVALFKIENKEENYDRMLEICKYMQSINDERKSLTKELTEGIEALWRKKEDVRVGVLHHESMKEGLAGLVAGRLKEDYNRPFFVLAPDQEVEGMYRGSARSIPGFDIKKALDRIQKEDNLLIKYGGHKMAAGLSLMEKDIKQFEKAINKIADEVLTEEDFVKKLVIDYAFTESEMDISILDELQFLQPYGQGFKHPVIGVREFIPVGDMKKLGDEGQHVQFLGQKCTLVSWHAAKGFNLNPPYKLWAVGELGFDAYNKSLKLVIEPGDFKNYK